MADNKSKDKRGTQPQRERYYIGIPPEEWDEFERVYSRTFEERHPYFPLAISIIALIASIVEPILYQMILSVQ